MILNQRNKGLDENSVTINSKVEKEGVDLKDINWETKMEKLQQIDHPKIEGIDQELDSWTQALQYQTQDWKYLFSSYLGLINKRKNIMLNRTQKIIQFYNDDRKVIRYAVILKRKHFDFQKDVNNQVVFYRIKKNIF